MNVDPTANSRKDSLNRLRGSCHGSRGLVLLQLIMLLNG